MARRGGNDTAMRQMMYFFLGLAAFFGIFGVIGLINGSLDVIGAIGIACAPLPFALILFLRLKRNERADRERYAEMVDRQFFRAQEQRRDAYRASIAHLPQPPALNLWNEGERRLVETTEELVIVRDGENYRLLNAASAKKKALVKIWFSRARGVLNLQKQGSGVGVSVNNRLVPEGVVPLIPGDIVRMGTLELTVR